MAGVPGAHTDNKNKKNKNISKKEKLVNVIEHVGEYFARDEERRGREASQIKTSAKFNMPVAKTCGRREKRGWRERGFGARHRFNMFIQMLHKDQT